MVAFKINFYTFHTDLIYSLKYFRLLIHLHSCPQTEPLKWEPFQISTTFTHSFTVKFGLTKLTTRFQNRNRIPRYTLMVWDVDTVPKSNIIYHLLRFFVGYENVSPHFENMIKDVNFTFFNMNPYNVITH